jgi:hypothetical protein
MHCTFMFIFAHCFPHDDASVIHPTAGARCSFLLKQKSLSFLSSGRIFGRDARWDMERANPPLTAESSVSTHTHPLLNIPPLDQSGAERALSAQWPLVLLARARDPMTAAAPQRARHAAPCLAMRLRRSPFTFHCCGQRCRPAQCVRLAARRPCPLAALTKCNQILRRRRHVIERCHALARPQSARDVACRIAAKCASRTNWHRGLCKTGQFTRKSWIWKFLHQDFHKICKIMRAWALLEKLQLRKII